MRDRAREKRLRSSRTWLSFVGTTRSLARSLICFCFCYEPYRPCCTLHSGDPDPSARDPHPAHSSTRRGAPLGRATRPPGHNQQIRRRRCAPNLLLPSFSPALTRLAAAWTVKEQVATAAIESGNFSLAEVWCALLYYQHECADPVLLLQVLVDRIAARFPTSSRVAVLKGMLFEGQGELHKAKELYEKRLLENQTDVVSFLSFASCFPSSSI